MIPNDIKILYLEKDEYIELGILSQDKKQYVSGEYKDFLISMLSRGLLYNGMKYNLNDKELYYPLSLGYSHLIIEEIKNDK